MLTHGSFFSGVGCFDLAAKRCGIKSIFHCEREYMERGVDFGMNITKLYAMLDHHTLLPKTLQCCLFEDSNESLPIFPKSGIALNGKLYERVISDIHIREKGFLSLPTPVKCDAKIILKKVSSFRKYYDNGHQDKLLYQCQLNGMTPRQTLTVYELMMGLPENWTKILKEE
jgi:hypothetical protein